MRNFVAPFIALVSLSAAPIAGAGAQQHVATLTVRKTVANNAGSPIGTITFPVTVMCGAPSNINATFTLTENAQHAVPNVAIGSACTVTEGPVAMLPIPSTSKCPAGTHPEWLASTYTPGGQQATTTPPSVVVVAPPAPSTVLVHNTLSCTGTSGKLGTLLVLKTVENPFNANLAGIQYPVTIHCGSSNPLVTLTGNPAHYVMSNVPVGTSCSVGELLTGLAVPPLPPGSTDCIKPNALYWTQLSPAYVPAGVVISGAHPDTITVRNKLACGGSHANGTLIVKKIVDNPYGLDLSAAQYPVQTQCGPSSTNVQTTSSFHLNAANSLQNTVSGLPVPYVCSAFENVSTLVIPADHGKCAAPLMPVWLSPTYNPASVTTSGTGPVTIEVHNKLDCRSPVGTDSLVIRKTLELPAVVQSMPNGTVFKVTVACTPGTPQTVSMSTPNGRGVVNGLAQGTMCTVTENLPSPNYVPPPLCHWVVSYIPGQTVPITASYDQVEVHNKLECRDNQNNVGQVQVSKVTTLGGVAHTFGMSFSVHPVCSRFGATVTLADITLSGANNYVTSAWLDNGTICSFTESSSTPIPSNFSASACHWSTTYTSTHPGPTSAQNTVEVSSPPGPYYVVVHNDLVCSDPARPTGDVHPRGAGPG